MRWVERVNGYGRKFRQWQPTAAGEEAPSWPSTVCPGCPICGEEYVPRQLTVDGRWVPTQRLYIYHDGKMHADYAGDCSDATVTELVPIREPGE